MSRGPVCALVLLLAASSVASLAAQEPETTSDTTTKPALRLRTATSLDGGWIDRLPVDRIEEALFFEPGVTVTRSGGLSFRGGKPEDFTLLLDGIPIRPGYRGIGSQLLPGSVFDAPATQPELGTNAVARLDLITGPLPARFGNAQSGVVELETRRGTPTFSVRGAAETDALFGDTHGPGFNRLQGSAGGAFGKLRLFGALALEGHHADDLGAGAENAPVFDLAGVDTTVAVPSAINDPFADTTFVDVTAFAVSRGQCAAFGGSANRDIADNYGVDCQGMQTPATNSATYSLAARLDYALSARSQLSLTGLASQDQQRFFSYQDLFNPIGLTAARGWSRVVNLAWRQELGSTRPLALRVGLSLQRDRAVSGPLTTESEQNSRSSFANLLLSPLDFRFDFESFPLDQELIDNYRDNIAGSRRSPYDLDNVDQYSVIDQYRNSPYGTGRFLDGGGPVGLITLQRENRNIGSAGMTWNWASHNTMAAGIELTRYTIGNYSHQLTSSIYSNVWLEKPVSEAGYLQNTFRLGQATVTAGLRYDHFATRASRPFVLDTVSSSPEVNTYHYFPTPNSYGTAGVTFNGQPLVKFVEDAGHGAVSPRVQAAFELNRVTAVRAGYARQNQMPDLGLLLLGINTDLRITNTNAVFGTDFGFEQTTIYEVGINRQIRPGLVLDLSAYERDIDHQPTLALSALADPARAGNLVDIRQIKDSGAVTVKGIELRLDMRSGPVQGVLGYSYQDAKIDVKLPAFLGPDDRIPASDSRPHTVAGFLLFDVPDGWRQGTLPGRVMSHVGASAGFRYSSGAPYTECDPSFVSALAGDPCFPTSGSGNGVRLPSFKQFDLRLTKGFSLGRQELTLYVDARNLLNFSNVVTLFAATRKTTNPAELAIVTLQDSASWASEANQNGIYTPGGDIDLTFGGAAASGCGNYVNQQGQPSAPSCVYLIRAEERFGNGDHLFSQAEQRRATQALYDVARGDYLFHSTPRRIRLGLEIRF